MEQLRLLAAESQGVSPDEVDTANMRAFYVLEGAYIDAALGWDDYPGSGEVITDWFASSGTGQCNVVFSLA